MNANEPWDFLSQVSLNQTQGERSYSADNPSYLLPGQKEKNTIKTPTVNCQVLEEPVRMPGKAVNDRIYCIHFSFLIFYIFHFNDTEIIIIASKMLEFQCRQRLKVFSCYIKDMLLYQVLYSFDSLHHPQRQSHAGYSP